MVKAMPREKERFCKRECVRGDAEDERPAVSSDSEQEEEQGFEHDDMDVMVRMLLCHGIFPQTLQHLNFMRHVVRGLPVPVLFFRDTAVFCAAHVRIGSGLFDGPCAH